MKVFIAQNNYTIGDIEKNLAKILASIREARERGADIVLFSELAVCGYPPEDLLLHKDFVSEVEKVVDAVSPATKDLFVALGTLRRNSEKQEKPLFNSAALFVNGSFVGYCDKILLPTYDVFDERRYFEPGKDVKVVVFKGKRIGITICEDIWQHAGLVGGTDYARDPVALLAEEGVDLLLNLSASPYQFDKPKVRFEVCRKAAHTLSAPVILCCQVGANDSLIFDGYSVAVDCKGHLQGLGKGFEEDGMLIDTAKSMIQDSGFEDPLADLYSALVLGVKDYFHKSGFTKGCLGLSGGIDSALVACIARDALGRENVLSVAMPSRYSSQSSIDDAYKLAATLGIECKTISIEDPFSSFLHLLEPCFPGKNVDVTEENLQARIRGMILMALSNKLGYVVLSTGNKSEMALGYCTLYGDMCGGLSVIADVAKTQVYALARWMNKKQEMIPLSIIEKAPSAELRPNQKDSDSLPDYATVDAVLEGYVEDMLTVEEICAKYGIDKAVVIDLIRRIHRAEYKRRQAAPSLRVTKKAFHAGRRLPIVQRWV